MAQQDKTTPPPRKEAGLLSRLFSRVVRFIFWLFTALIVSILIEWIGITWFWPEQGQQHAQMMLRVETQYLNERLLQHRESISQSIYQTTHKINHWITQDSGIMPFIQRLASPLTNRDSRFRAVGYQLFQNYHAYVLAVPYIAQLFFVRLAIILFSLPAFLLWALVGMIDGLVERDLRRWGGGRESSNLYNIARKSIFPAIVVAWFLYISLPITVHPTLIMMPFTLLLGLMVRITFGRLKKYF